MSGSRAAGLGVLMVCLVPAAHAQRDLPDGFVDELVADSLYHPVACPFLPDGRMLVAERITGQVRLVIEGSAATPETALVVSDVDSDFPEEGLLGLAVDPGWPERPYVYTLYTTISTATIRISRFRGNGDLDYTADGRLDFDPLSRHDILTDIPDASEIHNGGTLRFGEDGMLFASLGDDGLNCVAQDTTSLLGKILRLDVSLLPDGPGGPPARALITPANNPFVLHSHPNARLVWAMGLRNPFDFHIDPADGSLMIADVGPTDYEEVDWAPIPGMNFGWPHYEALRRTGLNCGVDTTNFTAPVFHYSRPGTLPGAVISIAIYRRPAGAAGFPPEYEGDSFFADHFEAGIRRQKRTGGTWGLAPPVPGQADDTTWSTGHTRITNGAIGPDGAMYYLEYYHVDYYQPTGLLRRIRYVGPTSVPLDPSERLFFSQAYPNPARDQVTLRFRLTHPAPVRVEVFDPGGRRVRVLLDSELRGAGNHGVSWDGFESSGRQATAGLYVVRIEAGGITATRRVVWLP